MYKYVIYCSISAVVFLASKYIYQNWLKIKHHISDLSSQILFLQNKVKTLESELEKRTISGGAQIPIEFKPIEKKSPRKSITISEKENELSSINASEESSVSSNQSNQSPKNNILNEEPKEFSQKPKSPLINTEELEQNSEVNNDDNASISSSEEKSFDKPQTIKISPSPQYNNSIELNQNNEILKELDELSNGSLGSLEKNSQINTNDITNDIEIMNDKKNKKSKLPDAKSYSNGDKINQNGIEYICVVGKRGGHSWKKIC